MVDDVDEGSGRGMGSGGQGMGMGMGKRTFQHISALLLQTGNRGED